MAIKFDDDYTVRTIVEAARSNRLFLWLQADAPDNASNLGRIPFTAIWSERGDFGFQGRWKESQELGGQQANQKQLAPIPSLIGDDLSFQELIPITFTRGSNFRYGGLRDLSLSREKRFSRDGQLLEMGSITTAGVVIAIGGGDSELWLETLVGELLNESDPILPSSDTLAVVLLPDPVSEQLCDELTQSLPHREENIYLYRSGMEKLLSAAIEEMDATDEETDDQFAIRLATKQGHRNFQIGGLAEGASRRLIADYHLIPSMAFNGISTDQLADAFKGVLCEVEPVWAGYRAGFPFRRHYKPFENVSKPFSYPDQDWNTISSLSMTDSVRTILQKCGQRRKNFTVTLQAEPGAGSTTLVRQVAFDVAEYGYPTFLARPGLKQVDYWQLTNFLTEFWRHVYSIDDNAEETAALLIFDEEHLDDARVTDIARLLENDGRNVVVVRVVPWDDLQDHSGASGNNLICTPLKSSIDNAEASALYHHLQDVLQPVDPSLAPQSESWEAYILAAGHEKTYFWVCLRYLLLERFATEVHGVLEDTITSKLEEAFKSLVQSAPDSARLLVYLAISTAFRIRMPFGVLASLMGKNNRQIRAKVQQIHEEMKYIQVEWNDTDGESQLLLNHSLFAKSVIRLFRNAEYLFLFENVPLSEVALSRMDIGNPVELLRLVLFELDHTKSGHVDYVETIAHNVLKLDSKTQFANGTLATRLLEGIDHIPLQFFETSPTVLQVRAITTSKSCGFLKSLAAHSSESDRTEILQTIRRRYNQSLHDMDKAISLLETNDVQSSEDPRILKTTLANIYLAWAAFEKSEHNTDDFNRMTTKAGALYSEVMDDWPDSTYARYGRARLLFENTEDDTELDNGLKDVENLEEALGLLDIQPDSSFYDEWEKLRSDILRKLDSELYTKHLSSLVQRGYEIGYVINARVIYQSLNDDGQNVSKLGEAISLLEDAGKAERPSNDPSRRLLLHSHCLCLHPVRKWDFQTRYDLLSEMDSLGCPMPLLLRYEYAVLCYQVDLDGEGSRQFAKLRGMAHHTSYQVDELEFWRESVSSVGNDVPSVRIPVMQVVSTTQYGGWARVEGLRHNVPYSQKSPWGRTLDIRQRVPCSIQFFRSGPRAVPPLRKGDTR